MIAATLHCTQDPADTLTVHVDATSLSLVCTDSTTPGGSTAAVVLDMEGARDLRDAIAYAIRNTMGNQ